jgi:hypothetical protein
LCNLFLIWVISIMLLPAKVEASSRLLVVAKMAPFSLCGRKSIKYDSHNPVYDMDIPLLWMPDWLLREGIEAGNAELSKYLTGDPPRPDNPACKVSFEDYWLTLLYDCIRGEHRQHRIKESDMGPLRSRYSMLCYAKHKSNLFGLSSPSTALGVQALAPNSVWPYSLGLMGPNLVAVALEEREESQRKAAARDLRRNFHNDDWTFAMLQTGEFAVAPPGTQVGDQVVVLAGAKTPILLRPIQDAQGCFRWVGSCYVHGYMDGEIIRRPDASERWTQFTII